MRKTYWSVPALWLFLCLLGGAPAAAHDFEVGPGVSGAWFDPARNGEGWIVEVLPDGRAVVYWFTYPPPGHPGTNAWILGTGHVDHDRIVITESVINRGARFGAAFDPADVTSESWGSWTMVFTSCEAGAMSFQGPAAFGSGEYTLARLSRIQGSPCGGGAHDPEATGFSGSWYDPASDGQGITLGILPDGRVLLYWFTFDPDGNQKWLLGIGESHGPRLEFPEVFAFSGTTFGDMFDPSAVGATPWGSLSITFDTCGAGTLSYRGPDETWGAGSMSLTRLSRLGGHPCQLPESPPLSKGRWGGPIPMTPGTSEVAVAVLDGKAYVAGDLGPHSRAFLQFDPETGAFAGLKDLPTFRNHAILAAVGDSLYLMGGRNADNNVYRYDPERNRWTRVAMYTSVGHASGVSMDGYIYVIGELGDVRRFNPETGDWARLSGLRLFSEGVQRDHANSVVFHREIWWLGGRSSVVNGYLNTPEVEIFDPVTRTWRKGPFLGQARSGFAAAVVNGQIMVAGGEDLNGPTGSLVPGMEVYSPGYGWRPGPDLPTPVHGVGGVELNGRFYLLGGSSHAGGAGSPGFSQVYIPGS